MVLSIAYNTITMKEVVKMKKFFGENILLVAITPFILLILSSWGIQSRPMVGDPTLIKNGIGLFSNWLVVYSDSQKRSLFSLLFEGNEGLHIKIVGLIWSLGAIFAVLFLINLLVKTLKSRAENKKGIDK